MLQPTHRVSVLLLLLLLMVLAHRWALLRSVQPLPMAHQWALPPSVQPLPMAHQWVLPPSVQPLPMVLDTVAQAQGVEVVQPQHTRQVHLTWVELLHMGLIHFRWAPQPSALTSFQWVEVPLTLVLAHPWALLPSVQPQPMEPIHFQLALLLLVLILCHPPLLHILQLTLLNL